MIESNKLFVGNLDRGIKRQDLKDFFEEVTGEGSVAFTSVASDRETGKSRGFGFVTFVNAEDAATAKDECNEKELNGRPIYIDFAKSRDEMAGESHESQEEESHEEESQEEEFEENEM